MPQSIYVSNIPFKATENDIQELFAQHGTVSRVNFVRERDSGRLRGFGFVDMEDGAEQAIAAINGQDFMGRALRVEMTQPKKA